MARQLRIVGTGRPGIPEVLEEASTDLLEARRDKRRITREQNDKVKLAEYKVLTLMQEHSIPHHTVKDNETEELLDFDLTQKLKITKTGEVDSEDGDGDDLPRNDTVGGDVAHPGLIRQAEKAQADANVSETSDGDVVPVDKSVPKDKGGRKKKGGAN